LAVAIAVLAPATAYAAVPVSVRASVVDASAVSRVVTVRFTYPESARWITAYLNGVAVADYNVYGPGSVDVPFEIPGPYAVVKAVARTDAYVPNGASLPLTLRAASFAPAVDTDLPGGSFVGLDATVKVLLARADSVLVRARRADEEAPQALYDGSADAAAAEVPFSLTFAEGRNVLYVTARNVWGERTIGRTYWRIEAPSMSDCVLIDKSDFMLYRVIRGRVYAAYPIAIGMPGTPTRTGTFRLGAPQPGGGAWGVLRMPLNRRVAGRWVNRGYFVHGTNDPDSIGTEASHGCVRMYNRDVRRLAYRTRAGTYCFIRE
ncbi:MAG: hypothetical protein C0418_06355, partial [Coriobacteriaceae bacterium]|nr:hypothetical protein [Coriobacteriaceae bacterium]